MWVHREIVEHRARDDECTADKCERVLPIVLEEILIREHEKWEEKDENDGSETESDIGVDAETEDASGKNEERDLSRSETAEEKIKRK